MIHTEHRKNQVSQKQVFISCIVPLYNEQDLAVKFLTLLRDKLQSLSDRFEIIAVDDGSHDQTVAHVLPLTQDNRIKLIRFSRNFGKEKALMAGLMHCKGDVTILIDADFQHPFDVMDAFLTKWAEGYDMVYGVRNDRKNESFLKRNFSKLFYSLMQVMTKESIPPDAGDFRLLDRKVVQAINQCPENNRFMKGLYAWVGFNNIGVPFEVNDRAGGKSSWRFTSLLELALTGITSFSDVPLRVWSLMGLFISLLSFIYATYIVLHTLIFGVDVPGYATIVTAIMFFGGVQLLSIGILGEYVARIFNEAKRRPPYIIADKLGFDEN